MNCSPSPAKQRFTVVRRSILLQTLTTVEGQLLPFGCQLFHRLFYLIGFGEVGITVPAAPPFPLPCDPAAYRPGRIRFGRSRLQKETENLLVSPQLSRFVRKIEFQEIAVFVLHHLDLTAQAAGTDCGRRRMPVPPPGCRSTDWRPGCGNRRRSVLRPAGRKRPAAGISRFSDPAAAGR